MSRFLHCLLITFALFCSLPALAGQGIIKGIVKYSNGSPAANRAVYIMPDSLAVPGCNVKHTIYTNANGYYIDTITCTNPVLKLRVKTEDCGGTWLSKDPQVGATGIVEINFSLNCNPASVCKAAFTFENDNTERSVQFNSSPSEGDDIISRKWTFGDGDSLTGNSKDPHHVYKAAGTYTACLYIKTATGCESHVCQQIAIADHCEVIFQYQVLQAGTVKTNSNASHGTSSTDNVTERIWTWGDGSTTKGNLIDPTHSFSIPGSYKVCLRIATAQNCSDSTCTTVIIPKPEPVTCYAKFKTSATATVSTLKFIADSVRIQANDTLAYYRWEFGDGSQVSGSSAQVEHHYILGGEYTVCLILKTRHGCEYKYCHNIAVAGVRPCKAAYTWERLSPKKIRVNAGPSTIPTGDSIVRRRWNFGDGVIIDGNGPNPTHEFKDYGNYNVCLIINTTKGCESSFCSTVKVSDSAAGTGDAVKITDLYPNPVASQLTAVIYSQHNNLSATLTTYDIYGNIKWSVVKILPAGVTTLLIPVQQLVPGPYVFKMTTVYGVVNRSFFKL